MTFQKEHKYLQQMRETIQRHQMISAGDCVVVGLSGGPDSVCLLFGLVKLKEELGIGHICAVHVHHGLRGAEADRDEQYCSYLAETLGVEFRAFHFDAAACGKEWGMGSEAAGRRLRYETFEKVARDIGAVKTAVAHNSDDQAETILMRILRGTGIGGLSGIEYVRRAGYGQIIRPVLDMSRAEIEIFCRENGLTPMRDSTNDQPIYTRNKIRLELLPHLKEVYNPYVNRALIRLGQFAGEDDDYLSSQAGKMIEKCWNAEEKFLQTGFLTDLHPAILKRVIRQAAAAAGADGDLNESRTAAVMELLKRGEESREADLFGGNYVRLSYGKLWFLKRRHMNNEIEENTRNGMSEGIEAKGGMRPSVPADRDDIPPEMSFPIKKLEVEGEVQLEFCGRTIRLCRMAAEDVRKIRREESLLSKSRKEKNPDHGDLEKAAVRLYLDWDQLKQRENLVFRFRQPGDMIRPRGMKGRKKLQDFFVDRKIPRHLRQDILLLADGKNIFFAGKEAAEDCCEKPDSASIVSIEY